MAPVLPPLSLHLVCWSFVVLGQTHGTTGHGGSMQKGHALRHGGSWWPWSGQLDSLGGDVGPFLPLGKNWRLKKTAHKRRARMSAWGV